MHRNGNGREMRRRAIAAKENGPVTALTVPRPISPIPNGQIKEEPMKSSTIVPENTSIETVPAESCAVTWCTTQHGWQDVDERSHSSESRVLDAFAAGRIEEESFVTTWHEQRADDGGPRTVVEISLVASYSSAELLLLADELQALAANLRADSKSSAVV